MRICPSCATAVKDDSRRSCPSCYGILKSEKQAHPQQITHFAKPTFVPAEKDPMETAMLICLCLSTVPFLGFLMIMPCTVMGVILLTRNKIPLGIIGLVGGPLIAAAGFVAFSCFMGLIGMGAAANNLQLPPLPR